jgi:hypothetical protein
MTRQLKVRIEVAGMTGDLVARLLREVARRIDDGRERGIIERDGQPVGAWGFEDTEIGVKAGKRSR